MTIDEAIEMTIDVMIHRTAGDVIEMTVEIMVEVEMIMMSDAIDEVIGIDVLTIETGTIPAIEVLDQNQKQQTPTKKRLQQSHANLVLVAAHPPPPPPHLGHPLDTLILAVVVPAALHLHPLVVGPDRLADVEMIRVVLLLPLDLEIVTLTSLVIVPPKHSLLGRNLSLLLVDRGEIVLDVRVDEGHPGDHLLLRPAGVVLVVQFVRESKLFLKKTRRYFTVS